MAFCCELERGCCGCPIRTTVCTGLCHYMVHGMVIVCFVFSNVSYPSFYYVDYFFGGSGAALAIISFFTAWLVDARQYQALRIIFAGLTVIAVLAVVVSTFYYTITRWNDVVVTAIVRRFRSPPLRDFPDELWYTISVISCLVTPVLVGYLVYLSSFMCNKWRSFLFTTPYRNDVTASALPPPLIIPADTYSTRDYKPYPVQKN